MARAQDVGAKVSAGAGRIDGGPDAGFGQRVLAADVAVATLGADREGFDGHGLDDREGVALEDDAVLEGARLRLVGVADDEVRLGRLGGDGSPLAPGREGGTATSQTRRAAVTSAMVASRPMRSARSRARMPPWLR